MIRLEDLEIINRKDSIIGRIKIYNDNGYGEMLNIINILKFNKGFDILIQGILVNDGFKNIESALEYVNNNIDYIKSLIIEFD